MVNEGIEVINIEKEYMLGDKKNKVGEIINK